MIRIILPEVLRYFRAAPWPHFTTLKVSVLSWLSGAYGDLLLAQERLVAGWVLWALSAAFLWGVILCQADALSRFREFKRIRRIFAHRGFRPRVLKLVSGSRCQRDAALLAASETGYRSEARSLFRELGYRWYHILPDAIVANPFCFFHPRFLRTTFLPGKRLTQE